MTRQAASANIFRNLLYIFLIFFAVFALVNTGLSFIYQPLFSFLFSVPTFTMIAVFTLIITLIFRQIYVEIVPNNMIGLVTFANGRLKTLAPAGPVWVWFGREELSSFLSLEPVSIHTPLVGLKSRDGVELSPLVTIITWRVHSTMTTLLSSQFRQQVIEVALESPLRRERRVRERVADVIARQVMQETLEELEDHLPNILHNGFGRAAIQEINQFLTPLGMKVERLECLGKITPPTRASEVMKMIGEARKKLDTLLRTNAADASLQQVQQRIELLLQRTRRAVQDMRATSRAVDDYVQAVINVLQQAHQHFKTQSDIQAAGAAQKAQSQRLTDLAADITALLEVANEIKDAAARISAISSDLTPGEISILFKVLEAIEQKKLPLGPMFP